MTYSTRAYRETKMQLLIVSMKTRFVTKIMNRWRQNTVALRKKTKCFQNFKYLLLLFKTAYNTACFNILLREFPIK